MITVSPLLAKAFMIPWKKKEKEIPITHLVNMFKINILTNLSSKALKHQNSTETSFRIRVMAFMNQWQGAGAVWCTYCCSAWNTRVSKKRRSLLLIHHRFDLPCLCHVTYSKSCFMQFSFLSHPLLV